MKKKIERELHTPIATKINIRRKLYMKGFLRHLEEEL